MWSRSVCARCQHDDSDVLSMGAVISSVLEMSPHVAPSRWDKPQGSLLCSNDACTIQSTAGNAASLPGWCSILYQATFAYLGDSLVQTESVLCSTHVLFYQNNGEAPKMDLCFTSWLVQQDRYSAISVGEVRTGAFRIGQTACLA